MPSWRATRDCGASCGWSSSRNCCDCLWFSTASSTTTSCGGEGGFVSYPMARAASSEPPQAGTAGLETEWHPPPTQLVAPRGPIHVWRASLDPPAPHVTLLHDVLSDS